MQIKIKYHSILIKNINQILFNSIPRLDEKSEETQAMTQREKVLI